MACDRFRQPAQDTNVGYVKNINFLRRTFLAPQMRILPLKLGVNFAFALCIIFFAHF